MTVARLALTALDCAEPEPRPDQWRVYLDPAGRPFCLTVNIPFDL